LFNAKVYIYLKDKSNETDVCDPDLKIKSSIKLEPQHFNCEQFEDFGVNSLVLNEKNQGIIYDALNNFTDPFNFVFYGVDKSKYSEIGVQIDYDN
jgi:hypothetical protein